MSKTTLTIVKTPVVETPRNFLAVPSPLAELADMLTYRRPNHSKSEGEFIGRYIASIPGVVVDAFGNLILQIGQSPIMWSAHTDTVHTKPGRQAVGYSDDGLLRLAPGQDSNCLGGDNTVGCWLLRRMALAGVPGLYVWHRAEESGCQGSRYLAKESPQLFDAIQFAIAFDRRGRKSIVTHQMCGRSASDAFALSLAVILGMEHEPDDGGIYTDTASYIDVIGECTNVSSGTANEHCATETVDGAYALALLASLLAADFSTLVVERKPGDYEEESWWNDDKAYNGKSGAKYLPIRGGYKELAWDNWANDDESSHHRQAKRDINDMREIIATYPDAIAEMLVEYGISLSDVENYLGTSVAEWR